MQPLCLFVLLRLNVYTVYAASFSPWCCVHPLSCIASVIVSAQCQQMAGLFSFWISRAADVHGGCAPPASLPVQISEIRN
ncbi:hypothetical protein C8R47DRAFT_1146773 [Mycena vitilis]|nr:hypothetical protein C8R47DRAFT_1152707 [Mycena vitilis]KAJ6472171.1 hypothetical protein C8R47DRAFT_1146773 [Mycena vitilis]